LTVRLTHLPHDELVLLAAQGMREGNETRSMGEEMLALHVPPPEWAVTDVLLSPDLLVSVLSTLTGRNGYTASVCKAWQLAWKDKNRGVLRPVRSIKDANLSYPQHVVALPDGGALVANWGDSSLRPYSSQGEAQPGLCGHVGDGQYQTIRGLCMPSARWRSSATAPRGSRQDRVRTMTMSTWSKCGWLMESASLSSNRLACRFQ